MSWSYSQDPTTSPMDEVRFLIGDTNPSAQQLQDQEILYNIALVYGPNPPASGNFLPAAYCADAISSNYARKVDKSVGDLHITYSQGSKNFQDLANRLRQRATLSMVPVYAGGQSIADKIANYVNADQTQAEVKVDGMNYADSIIPGSQTDGSDGT